MAQPQGAHRSGALSPLRQQPMEPTHACLEQLQEGCSRDGLQTLAVKARALTRVSGPQGGREIKQHRKAAVSPGSGANQHRRSK